MNGEASSISIHHGKRVADWLGILVICCVATGLMVVRSYFQGTSTVGRTHHAVGSTIPVLSLAPLVNASDKLELADLQGKVSLLNFWGTWCPPCRAEFPHVVQIGERFADHSRFQLVSVSCGNGPEEFSQLLESTQAFLRRQDARLPVYWDPDGFTRQGLVWGTGLSSFGYPITVLIDGSVRVRALWPGFRESYADEMVTIIDQLLQEGATDTR